ncbi:MAG: DUF4249 domain-containing protein [Leadbetterella sp.]
MKRFGIVLFAFLGIVFSCIDPVDLNLNREVNYLVVEGNISNLAGPHLVKLKQSAAYTKDYRNDFPVEFPISGAKVYVKNEKGEIENFVEDKFFKGSYYSSVGFQAKEGLSYQVFIETKEGKKFESIAEKIISAPEIEESRSEFKDDANGGAFPVFVKFKDKSTPGDFYRMDWRGWNTIGLVQFDQERNRPLQCIGGNDSYCFFTERGKGAVVLSDNQRNGNSITEQVVAIPYNQTFDYFLEARIYSITQKAYVFWKSLIEQSQRTGGVTDKVPAEVTGNMICTSNPNEKVLGYFEVAGARSKKIKVSRTITTPITRKSTDVVGCRCTVYSNDSRFPNVTANLPLGW